MASRAPRSSMRPSKKAGRCRCWGSKLAARIGSTATLVDAAGNKTKSDILELETPDIPADFPPITVNVSHPLNMEPGVTFFKRF